jgi:uncharacterized membrane protein YidH (DUF202 family)
MDGSGDGRRGSSVVSAQPIVRPARIAESTPPPIPQPDESDAENASTIFSKYRTHLSRHRTRLSEHRTQLSEHRTDLSTYRTSLSTSRTEMSMRRTGMSFQRTRLSADRTLMSVIRTALSLIGFGFTIAQIFQKMHAAAMVQSATAGHNFGVALVVVGCVMLGVGIAYHVAFMRGLRGVRENMQSHGLVHAQTGFPVSFTLLTAVLLFLMGLFVFASMIFGVGPFR